MNNLTEFFYTFHEQTVNYKKELEQFMEMRKHILDRFNASSINIYDMTVIPDDPNSVFTIENKPGTQKMEVVEKINRNFQQIPFTRTIKFKKEDIEMMGDNLYFLCSARLSFVIKKKIHLKLGIVTDTERMKVKDLVDYVIVDKDAVIMLNRII